MRKKVRIKRTKAAWYDPKKVKGWLEHFDLKVKKHSRLKMKVYVFETQAHLLAFYRLLGYEPPKTRKKFRIGGFVWGINYNIESFATGKLVELQEVDPEYFAVMALCKDHLDVDTVAHECTHAGFAYAKRINRAFDWRAFDFDEENVCYPTGILMMKLCKKLQSKKLA